MKHCLSAAALLLLGSITAACDDPVTTIDVRTGTVRDSADQIMYGVRAAVAHAGLRRGELVADTGLSLDAATRFELRGIRVQFTSTLGRPLGVLTTREGTFYLNRALLETRGPATIVSDTSGRNISGGWVRYDATANELASDSPFVATGRGRRLTGVGFTADPGLFTVRCAKQCTGSLAR